MVKEFDEKSCGIVVYREKDGINLYLLLHYPSGHWDLPKGHVEANETEHQTAARELLEETGISDVHFIDGFREEISYQYRRNKNQGGASHGVGGKKISDKQVIFFLGKTKLEEIKLSHEHHGFKWLPYEAAYNKLTFDNAKNLVKKAKNFLGE
jgi:8-oxo-dGTP pyrophosphatase MutT (NUDIX family)